MLDIVISHETFTDTPPTVPDQAAASDDVIQVDDASPTLPPPVELPQVNLKAASVHLKDGATGEVGRRPGHEYHVHAAGNPE